MALWDHVQSRSVDSGTGTSATLAYNSNIVAGNLLVIAVRSGGTAANPVITDSQGNTYTRHVLQTEGTDHQTSIHSAIAISSAACTVTLTTGSVTRRWAIHEYDSAGTTVTKDQHASAQGDSTTPSSGNTATTSSASELLFGASSCENTSGFTPGTNYTERQEQPASPNAKIDTEDRVVSGTGTYAADWTISTQPWSAGIVTFQSNAAGATFYYSPQSFCSMGIQ